MCPMRRIRDAGFALGLVAEHVGPQRQPLRGRRCRELGCPLFMLTQVGCAILIAERRALGRTCGSSRWWQRLARRTGASGIPVPSSPPRRHIESPGKSPVSRTAGLGRSVEWRYLEFAGPCWISIQMVLEDVEAEPCWTCEAEGLLWPRIDGAGCCAAAAGRARADGGAGAGPLRPGRLIGGRSRPTPT